MEQISYFFLRAQLREELELGVLVDVDRSGELRVLLLIELQLALSKHLRVREAKALVSPRSAFDYHGPLQNFAENRAPQ